MPTEVRGDRVVLVVLIVLVLWVEVLLPNLVDLRIPHLIVPRLREEQPGLPVVRSNHEVADQRDFQLVGDRQDPLVLRLISLSVVSRREVNRIHIGWDAIMGAELRVVLLEFFMLDVHLTEFDVARFLRSDPEEQHDEDECAVLPVLHGDEHVR